MGVVDPEFARLRWIRSHLSTQANLPNQHRNTPFQSWQVAQTIGPGVLCSWLLARQVSPGVFGKGVSVGGELE